ncbi:N-acetylmuramoyl-L-alanine amidase [Mesobacillus zeae]|uniref:N-acetylmuramoyl-L-alanine amidase n=1 Tax=Mesobacillus zeae TaxID=1917180 RepID=A0A398B1L6_9BACI|nr:N-acetylmuramoyl-L-alanine amidase [Mesobacillus zeae]RID83737.1 N-acetylmuramoyl-L-alanine amidase [Mesobacillus zeae]
MRPSRLFMLFFFIPLFFVNSGSAAGLITLTASSVNIREGPGLHYPVLEKAIEGKEYSAIEQEKGWIKIRLDSNKTGWVSSEYTERADDSAFQQAIVDADSLRVREGPGTAFAVIGSIRKGQAVSIVKHNEKWAKISSGRFEGWVSKEFLAVGDLPRNDEIDGKAKENVDKQEQTVSVNVTLIKVRNKPIGGKIIGTAEKDEKFTVLDEKKNWIQLKLRSGKKGWAPEWLFSRDSLQTANIVRGTKITILNNGTSIRDKPGPGNKIIKRAGRRQTFKVISFRDSWYEIRLPGGRTGYVAGSLASVNGTGPQIATKESSGSTRNKTIVIDPGHGGKDSGTAGSNGLKEKNLTSMTAHLLYDKLRIAGANVIMTRYTDTYLPLTERIKISHDHHADAFISIHYDSTQDSSIRGTTSYYYHQYQQPLAEQLHTSISHRTNLEDRGVRQGNYHVIRENSQNAALLELGYLSNSTEENIVETHQYQEAAARGIYEGLNRYFQSLSEQ